MRTSGILMPVSSLPSRYGIGCFSKEAYEFVDFLKDAGQTYWQVLPIGPTGFGDSPYQPFSAFAGNPYFIDLETLIQEGLLERWQVDQFNFGDDVERVDYGAQYNHRYLVLKMAFDRFRERGYNYTPEFREFVAKESFWLEDYALFMSMKRRFDNVSWLDWDKEYKEKDPEAIAVMKDELAELIEFYQFQQYEFYIQWNKLRAYANKQGILIIGDIPFYVAMDSADAWAHPEVFKFNEDLMPEVVAGCPPDAFSETGQLWGNPVYDWDEQKATGYDWWIKRLERNCEFFDVLRFDHFHGFDGYYEIPYEAKTALDGVKRLGPGMDFFNAVKEKLGDLNCIAEDLGISTKRNRKLLKDAGYPGMKVLQFAFDATESSFYLPYCHIKNCVVYTGTHDNTTILDWISTASDHDRDYVRRYIHSENTDYGAFVWDFIREAYRSVADTCIVPLQDYLVKGKEARINTPGEAGNNWQWRLRPNFLSPELAKSIYGLAKVYGRIPSKKKEEDEEKKDEEE